MDYAEWAGLYLHIHKGERTRKKEKLTTRLPSGIPHNHYMKLEVVEFCTL